MFGKLNDMNKILLYITLSTVVFVTGCVKNTLFNPQPDINEPEELEKKTLLLINIDWEETLQNDNIETFNLTINDKTYTLEEGEQVDTINIEQGEYEIHLYNLTSGINIIEKQANMVLGNKDYIISSPQSFYHAKADVDAGSDELIQIRIKPLVRTRVLSIILDMPHDSLPTIKQISGYITNIAGSYDMNTEEEKNNRSLTLNFTSDTCIVNIFGTVRSQQYLYLEVVYESDTTKVTDIDISHHFIDFNSNKNVLKQIRIEKQELNELFHHLGFVN